MPRKPYDAIVVGARCAGSPAAMLLARNGYKVLLVDKATFPSDTISTHLVHPQGVATLKRWGLLHRLQATGCPPIHTYSFDFGDFTLAGSPGIPDSPVSYSPRRRILDKLLLNAAYEAGCEVREGFTVTDLVVENGRVTGVRGHAKGGRAVIESARVVVGADGLHSSVAKAVAAEQYNGKPPILAAYYTYWSGLWTHGCFENYLRPARGIAAMPTHDGLTLVIAGWPFAEFEANKQDVESNYLKAISLVPEFAERLRAARREERFAGAAVPNYFRKPFGPGWVLVGDAGYNKDFITAQGITDAFRDAELCTGALDDALSGRRPFEAALRDYQSARDADALPMYEFTAQVATLQPPAPELAQVLRAIRGNREAMDGYARVNAGMTSPAEFFSEQNVSRMVAASR